MRALVFLLLVALAFFLVLEFYPSSAVQGAPVPGEVVEQGPDDVTADSAVPRGFVERPALPEPEIPVEQPAEAIPGWLDGVEPPAPVFEFEVPLAVAMLRGTSSDVARAASAAEADAPVRALMARSYALARSGKAREGLREAGRIEETRLSDLERRLLQEALGGAEVPIRSIRSEFAESPLTLAMAMGNAERRAQAAARERRYREAAELVSELLLAELDAPWKADVASMARWTELLNDVQRNHRWHPKGDWPAAELTVQPGDTAIAVRKRYLAKHPGRVMCAGLILRSNAVSGYLQAGQRLRVPTEPVRMLVDLEARWALYLMGEEVAGSWPVGIGRAGEETITGVFTAGNKLENPPWMKVGQEMVPFGSPENPLGTRWIGWFADGVKTSYGFHGTWEPESIGHPSSDGCVRFRNADVEVLFEILPEGSPILVRP